MPKLGRAFWQAKVCPANSQNQPLAAFVRQSLITNFSRTIYVKKKIISLTELRNIYNPEERSELSILPVINESKNVCQILNTDKSSQCLIDGRFRMTFLSPFWGNKVTEEFTARHTRQILAWDVGEVTSRTYLSWICSALDTVVRRALLLLTSYLAFRTRSLRSHCPSANPRDTRKGTVTYVPSEWRFDVSSWGAKRAQDLTRKDAIQERWSDSEQTWLSQSRKDYRFRMTTTPPSKLRIILCGYARPAALYNWSISK